MIKQTLLKQILLLAVLTVLLALGAVVVYAQSDIKIERFTIQLWPEFDQPETLIIAHGNLSDAPSFPVTLTFNLPPEITEMNAVAILAEDGSLLNHPYELIQRDGAAQLSFALGGPMDFYFEYYDPNVMTKNGDERALTYQFLSDYDVQDLSIEVQQPPEAQEMKLSPEPDDVIVGDSRLTYHIYRKSHVAPGEGISFSGSYQKQGDTLTNDLVVNIPEPSEAEAPNPSLPSVSAPAAETDWKLWLGYGLVGLGAAALVFAGVMWYLNRNDEEEEEVAPAPRRASRKKGKAPAARVPRPKGAQKSTSSGSDARFCPYCGTAYKQDALFCHKCGKSRR